MANTSLPQLPILGNGHAADLGPTTLVDNANSAIRGNQAALNMPSMSYMELILTDQCNLRCGYGFEADKNPHIMADETAFGAVDFLMDASRATKNLTLCSLAESRS